MARPMSRHPRLPPRQTGALTARPHPRCRSRGVHLELERLETRMLLSAGDSSANAFAISFASAPPLSQQAHTSRSLVSAASPEQGNDPSSLQALTAETAVPNDLNDSLAQAQPINVNSRISG